METLEESQLTYTECLQRHRHILNNIVEKLGFLPFLNLFLIGGELLYNIVLISARRQHESALGIQKSPPSLLNLPPTSHPISPL